MPSSISRYLIAVSASLLFASSFLFLILYILPEYIYPLNWPFYGWMLILLFMESPVVLICVYALLWALVPPHLHEVGGIPKNWKGWAFGYVFLLAYILYWALWAFIFDTFIPFIPLFYRQIIAPQIIIILTLIILNQVEGFWKIIRRLFDV